MRKKLEEIMECSASRYLSMGLALILVGIFLASGGIRDVISLLKLPSDFNMMTPSQCKSGEPVQGEISSTIGYYWESVTTRNGIEQDFTRKRIYLIPYGYDKNRFIGINIGRDDFGKFEKLMNDTSAYFKGEATYPETIGIYEGYIKNVTPE